MLRFGNEQPLNRLQPPENTFGIDGISIAFRRTLDNLREDKLTIQDFEVLTSRRYSSKAWVPVQGLKSMFAGQAY
ncbi:hypothetical protein N7540_003195 [Penicillium herquei]|nr:hypothetical protein N7540_003195 [Penicillium herquei]